MNPGKIVRPTKMDDRTLFRFKPGYAARTLDTALDWSEWSVPGAQSQGFAAAVEMCNNNGHCRKFDAGTMCPSFRATGDEQHLTRGRANTLRLASPASSAPTRSRRRRCYDTMALCVSCKGCKRECPTGVDMAQDEDRVPAPLSRTPRPLAQGPPGRVPAALRIGRVATGVAAEPARPRPVRRDAHREAGRTLRAAPAAGVARAAVPALGRRALPGPRAGGVRRRAARRHVQQLLRARERPCRAPRPGGGRLPRARRARGGRRATPLLRPDVPGRRHGERGARRGAPHGRGARARTSRAASPSSASSPRACSACATSSCRCSRTRPPERSQ